jgi:hypothetical protein
MRIFRAGLAADTWDSPKFLRCYQSVELHLAELRSYLYANANAVQGYAKALSKGEACLNRTCRIDRQSAHQLALLQEAADEVDPSRRASLAACQDSNYQRNACPIHRPGSAASSGIRPPSFYGLDLSDERILWGVASGRN